MGPPPSIHAGIPNYLFRRTISLMTNAPFRIDMQPRSKLIETGHGGRAGHDWNSTTDHLLCPRFLHDIRSFYYTPRRSRIRNAFCIAEGGIYHDGEPGDRGNMAQFSWNALHITPYLFINRTGWHDIIIQSFAMIMLCDSKLDADFIHY